MYHNEADTGHECEALKLTDVEPCIYWLLIALNWLTGWLGRGWSAGLVCAVMISWQSALIYHCSLLALPLASLPLVCHITVSQSAI